MNVFRSCVAWLFTAFVACSCASTEVTDRHYVAIPPEYVPSTREQFNKVEMNREFEFGRQMALDGIEWRTSPPGYTAPQSQVTQQ